MPTVFTLDDLLRLQQPTTRVPLHLSPDGRRLAFCTQPVGGRQQAIGSSAFTDDGIPVEMAGSQVRVVDTTSGVTVAPFPAGCLSWGARWSPDGRRLAAYVCHEGPPCLGLWTLAEGEATLLRQAPVHPFFGFEVPQWTSDSQAVVLKLSPTTAIVAPRERTGHTEVTVFSFDPLQGPSERAMPTFLLEQGQGDLAIVAVAGGQVRRLAADWTFRGWKAAPVGRSVAVLRAIAADATRQQGYSDLVVLSLEGDGQRVVAEGIAQSYGVAFTWSPDGRALAYTTRERGKPGRLFVVPADAASQPKDLSAGISADFAQDYEGPRWSADGRTLYILAAGAVWMFAADGSGHREIRPELGRDVWGWLQPFGRPTLWTPGDEEVLLLTRDAASKAEGIARLNLHTGQAQLQMEGDQTFATSAGMPLVEAHGNTCCTLLEAANHPPELYAIAKAGDAIRRLASLNPALDDAMLGTARLLEWRAADGLLRRGAVLLPPDYREGQRVPLIVEVYGGSFGSNDLHHFGFGGAHVDNTQVLASQGYAVLHPDLPMRDRDPLRQVPGLVLPAVDKLIELGIADPERLALWGHSYGGYGVLALLTQTDRFRAAVASAAWGINLTSIYGTLNPSGDSQWLGWTETGQAGLHGTPWEKRDAYIENSPFFYLDRVRTPLLLVCGTGDHAATAQADEAFSALRRLRQRVELLRYRDEDHWPGFWSDRNVRDLCTRVLAWYATYLCGANDGAVSP